MGYGSEPFRSLALIEMPLIFFISGASIQVSRSHKGLLSTVANRIKRVLLPYYIYAAVSLMLLSILSFTNPESWDICRYTLRDLLSIIQAEDIPQMPVVWHIWFILPYLVISCSMPIQQWLIKKIGEHWHLLLCIVLYILSMPRFNQSSIFRTITCYNIFFITGYLYYKRISLRCIVFTLCASFMSIIALLYHYKTSFCPMQGHKFPPDLIFVSYGIFIICLFGLLASFITIPHSKLLHLWSQRGYTIYLYQNIAIWVAYLVLNALPGTLPTDAEAIFCSLCIFFFSMLISYITYPLERFIIQSLSVSKIQHPFLSNKQSL